MTPRDFLRTHFAAHPEEASTLGVTGYGALLPDPSPEAAHAERAHCRAALDALDGADDDLDRDAVRRVALFYERYAGGDRNASNLELAALPNAMLQHGALHARDPADWDAIAERAAKVPGYLATHAENLRRGAVDEDVADVFRRRILPGAADAVASLPFAAGAKRCPSAIVARISEAAQQAGAAYRAFTIDAPARADVVLGAEETAFRLRHVMGVAQPIDELLRDAREELTRASRSLDHATVMALFTARPATLDDALAGYRRHLVDATNFVRDHEIVRMPPGLALDLEPLPGGIADGAALTNWPAPLFDPRGKGHALYASDPNAHATVAMKNLAVHEGIPGHYLQSVVWQRRANLDEACRYLGVADDVAFARGYFGTMISVEGWAVHMERTMRRRGFYDAKEELLFFDWCDAIRAMRVIVDLELHTGRMNGDEATRFVAESTFMPESWARAQVVRSKRGPLQSSTYFVGAREIERLRAQYRGDDVDFHDRLLALGPVPPSRAFRTVCS